ncbi:hypothetical protein SLV14_004903 [Streptomyces sp. Je 1-4]|uniref:hypothetical protein n=1 Tax=Streptomyces TaxID=1883 RepID=UPI0021DA88AF|nr:MULTISPECIES: hypothetical protein [unclassified Streptomyces]UYB42077.1 hypothetical protein SLV14_004903 [Streptomyces sp. Je 1-4]UZQ38357.1 hypothetical protein SLV14N_004903 [Streptomyces sp. Je 1-4] [Streptomyces sp. Je 1-4 4N24]UZQ45774.1 hypothetical protein SLV14NA_004903 [Streptomyces sp. Je 1-4] [Streptomyces sp. Je 1-4 4N24_ara]
MRQRRRAAVASTAALVLAGAGIMTAAGTAQAAEVSYKTECLPPPISGLPPIQGTTKVAVSAPGTAKVGEEVEVVWKTLEGASKNPDILDLGENTVQPTGTIKVAGAQTGDLAMQGPRENPPIPKGGAMKLSDMKGKLKLTKPGEVTLTPGFYNINVNRPISTDTKCSPKETVQPAVTIKVTDGGGGSGGTTGGTTTGTTGGTTTGTTGGTTAGGTTSGTTGGSAGTASGGGTDGGTTSGSSGGTASGGSGGDPDGTAYKGKEVEVPYACKTPIGDKKATSPVQINAVKKGGSYDLTVKFGKSVMDSPADIPKDSVKPSMDVKVGGADKGSVKVEGPTNAEPIKSGQPIEIPDLKGTYKPGATGKATLTPGVLTVNALGTTTTCTPEKDPGVSLALDTSAQQGGTSGTGGDSGGAAASGGSAAGPASVSGGSGGGLAETGAGDHGALTALGLVAGTVILLGGAVFTFSPRRRARVR